MSTQPSKRHDRKAVRKSTGQLRGAGSGVANGQENVVLFLDNLIENISDAFIATDTHFNIIQWNKAAELIYGWKSGEVLGKPIMHIVKTEYLKGSGEEAYQKILQNGIWSDRVIQTRKDGIKISIHSTVSLMRDGTGIFTGLAAVNRDITEGKQAEERFRLAVESAPNAIIMVDRNGLIVLVNSQAEKYFGYRRDELLNQRIEILVPIRFADHHPDHRSDFLKDPHMRAMGVGQELFARRKDGSEFPVEIGLAPIEMRDGNYVMATIVDITERKQAEERFRLAVESAPNAIIMVDRHGKIFLANSQTEKYFGYDHHELIGTEVDQLVPMRFRTTHSDHRAGFLSNPQVRSMGVGRDLYALRKDESEFPVEIGLVPIETPDGTLILVTIVDITERKQSEDETLRLNRELEAFAYSVSHDLRAPLRGIGGFSGILTEKYSSQLDDEGQRYVSRIQSNVQRMGRMIDDLLFLSKMTRQELHIEMVDLSAIANEIADELRAQEPGRNVLFETEEDIKVQCDAGMMRIVIQNLMENAWKFTSKKEDPQIKFGIHPQGEFGKKVFFIKDNGAGFDMNYANKLFTAFQRLHTEDEFPGTGIGLATVQRIIHRHGGRIWVEAQEDQGATFLFYVGSRSTLDDRLL